jgi:hypothetical protein
MKNEAERAGKNIAMMDRSRSRVASRAGYNVGDAWPAPVR